MVTAAPEQKTKDLSPTPNPLSIVWAETSLEPMEILFWPNQFSDSALPHRAGLFPFSFCITPVNLWGLQIWETYFIAKTSDKKTCGLARSAESLRVLDLAQHWDKEGNPGPTECQKSQTSPWAWSVEDFCLSLKLLGQWSSTVCASPPREAGFVGAGLADPDVP